MTFAEVWELIKNGGPPVILLLVLAIIWLNGERKRLIDSNEAKDAQLEKKSEKLENLSERTLVLTSEIKTLLFSNGRAS